MDEEWVEDEKAEAFFRLLEESVDEILRTEDGEQFLAWVRREAPDRFPEIFGGEVDERARHSLATVFGYSLWDVTPLPRNGFRPQPLERPAGSRPCPCGSGRSYEACCGDAVFFPGLTTEDVWVLMVERLPADVLVDAAEAGGLPRPLLGQAARHLLEAGRSRTALRLVEPLFERPARLDAQDGDALHALLDAYEELGWSKKRRRVTGRLANELRPPLSGVLWQHESMQRADQGDMPGAWEAFARAQRDDPESSALAPLEVTLLMNEDRPKQAVERARFWLARLRRSGSAPGDEMLTFLEEVTANPSLALLRIAAAERSRPVERLAALLAAGGARGAGYTMEMVAPAGSGFARLVAPARLARLERRWHHAFPFGKPLGLELEPRGEEDVWSEEGSRPWLAFLEEQPLALASLDVLDDLCLAAEVLATEVGSLVEEPLLAPLVGAATATLDELLAAFPRVGLPWALSANRPALRLLVLAAVLARRRGDRAEVIRRMEQVLRLNSADEHGIRSELIGEHLAQEDDEAALGLARGWAGAEQPEIGFGAAVALYRLGRHAEAREALVEAAGHAPLLARTLVVELPRGAALPAQATLSADEEEAWLYRQESEELWCSLPELRAWLAEAVDGAPRARRGAGRRPGAAPVPVYQLRVTLVDSDPPIWRRLRVAGDTPLDRLHQVLQAAMGWTDSHLHSFVAGRAVYGEPDTEDPRPLRDERRFRLCDLAGRKGTSFFYEYDFGDDWQHRVMVEEISRDGGAARVPALCLDGARCCPPEDCGGVWGYAQLLETLADARSPERAEVLDWLGGDFDPEAFDPAEANRQLALLE